MNSNFATYDLFNLVVSLADKLNETVDISVVDFYDDIVRLNQLTQEAIDQHETGQDTFLVEALGNFDYHSTEECQEPKTVCEVVSTPADFFCEVVSTPADFFYDPTLEKEFKAQKRKRFKKTAYYKIELENRTDESLANERKRSTERNIHPSQSQRCLKTRNIAKKCKHCNNENVKAYLDSKAWLPDKEKREKIKENRRKNTKKNKLKSNVKEVNKALSY